MISAETFPNRFFNCPASETWEKPSPNQGTGHQILGIAES